RGDPAISLDRSEADADQHQQDQQDGQHAAQEAAAAGTAPPSAPAGSPRGGVLVLGLGELVEGEVLVGHQASSSVGSGGCSAAAASTLSPARAPVARSVSSACWRIITAATWSTTERCLRPLRPERCSA